MLARGSATRTSAGGAGGPRGEQRRVGRHAVERRVLLVDHDEVEAERAEDLGRVGGRRLDEGADQVLAGEQPAAKHRGVGHLTGSRHALFASAGASLAPRPARRMALRLTILRMSSSP